MQKQLPAWFIGFIVVLTLCTCCGGLAMLLYSNSPVGLADLLDYIVGSS